MDTSSLNVKGLLAQVQPQGPSQQDDTILFTTATVLDVDPAPSGLGRVRVSPRGGDVWLPAIAGKYGIGLLARVLLDPTSSRPILVVGPVTSRDPVVLGAVTATGSGTVTVTVNGVAGLVIPAPLGTYTVGQSAYVQLNDWGTPVIAVGPSTVVSGPVSAPPPAAGGGTVVAQATIAPQVTGTWKSAQSVWDQWNVNRYGLGSTPVYQGNAYGSGLLVGFAGYGNQIVNLGAVSIASISMQAVKGADGNSAVLTVQGSPSGSRPGGSPSSSGDTASTGSIPSGGTGSLGFTTNMCNAFQSGAAKGLVAVGSQYGGFGGVGVPPSFVLQVTYTKNR